MTNLQRLQFINDNYGKYLNTQNPCVKQPKNGWVINLSNKTLIQLNNNNPVVKGKQPGGLLEALVVLQNLVKKYNVMVQVQKTIKNNQQQPTTTTTTTK